MTSAVLGDILYADRGTVVQLEEDWVALVRRTAEGDVHAFYSLYERTRELVFTLITRIIASAPDAERATLDVFVDLWQRSVKYNTADGTVLAWIMNLARSKAIGRVRLERKERIEAHAGVSLRDQGPQPEIQTALHSAEPATRDDELLSPAAPLWPHLAQRVAESARAASPSWEEPTWKEVAPGIACKLLSTDRQNGRVSMLVRLAPGVDYPPHRHSDVEELHMLHGELWIDDRKLIAGDYNRAEPGTVDERVWSRTGCTCALTTSMQDELR